MVLRLHQHSIGYTGDSFYRSEDPTNSIKVLKEHRDYTINNKYNKHTKKQNTANPLVYNTRGWLPQRARLPSLNGGGAATTVPPQDLRQELARTLRLGLITSKKI